MKEKKTKTNCRRSNTRKSKEKSPSCKRQYRVCEKRIEKNKHGRNMCGSIGCCEVGDMICECPYCQRKCRKRVDPNVRD